MSTLGFWKRYLQGECSQVWSELIALKSEGRRGEGDAVVREFVRRAADNLVRLRDVLSGFGFQFQSPESVVVLATERATADVEAIEDKFGQLPMVLRYWWELIHSIDFTLRKQSPKQIWNDHDGFVLSRDTLYIVSPREALQLALDYQNERREHDIRIRELQQRQPELADRYLLSEEDQNFLPLGPCASNCDSKGFELPCAGIDGFYFDDGDGETSFGEDFRCVFTGPGIFFSPGLGPRERKEKESRLLVMREKLAAVLVPL
jgi:hypothetical protein